eukprot:PRCOL_00005578-RA
MRARAHAAAAASAAAAAAAALCAALLAAPARAALAAASEGTAGALHMHSAARGPPFDGNYTDPNHPGCPRTVCYERGVVTGADGDPGCEGGAALTWWSVPIVRASRDGAIVVDFSSKGGPKDLKGEFGQLQHVSGIRWQDGNFWRLRAAWPKCGASAIASA